MNPTYWQGGTIKWISSKYINDFGRVIGYEFITEEALQASSTTVAPKDSTIVISRVSVGKIAYADDNYALNQDLTALIPKDTAQLDPWYLFLVAGRIGELIAANAQGIGVRGVTQKFIADLQIPLPPLPEQAALVAEVEGYQRIIDGARQVVANWRPRIEVEREWPVVALGDIARLINGRAYKQEELLTEGPVPVLRVGNFFSNRSWYYSDLELEDDKYCDEGDLLYAWSASFGPRIWEGPRAIYHYHIWKIETAGAVDKKFLYYLLEADSEKIKSEGNGIAMRHATKAGMEKREFPLPPLVTQQKIVAGLEAEQRLVDATRALIPLYERKIAARLARVWGE